jgi:hypothetical protein
MVLGWMVENPDLIEQKVTSGKNTADKLDTILEEPLPPREDPKAITLAPNREPLKELENEIYQKSVMDTFKKISQYYFKNVLHISRIYSCIQSFMTVYTSQTGADLRSAKTFLFDTYYLYLDAFYQVRNY